MEGTRKYYTIFSDPIVHAWYILTIKWILAPKYITLKIKSTGLKVKKPKGPLGCFDPIYKGEGIKGQM